MADEFYFHHRRGLPRWERIGHPLDTFTVILCYAYLLSFSPTPAALVGFVALATFSCLFVTKDEFVHAELCSAGESWLHSVLFILHPVCFFVAARLWLDGQGQVLFAGQSVIITGFLFYQIFYWGFYATKPSQ